MIVNRRHFIRVAAGVTIPLTVGPLWSKRAESDPWSSNELMEPGVLATMLREGSKPLIISVGFPMLYRQKHILHALLAGPANKPEGISQLTEAVARTLKNSSIVIYCGCCPMTQCPNLRPGFSHLKDLGYSDIRVLNLPMNFLTDWTNKGYPVESSLSTR